MQKKDTKEVVLKGDSYWQIIVGLKGTEDICYPLHVYFEEDGQEELGEQWKEHVAAVLEHAGFFDDTGSGCFVNYDGKYRKRSDVDALVAELAEDAWVKENVTKLVVQEIGAVSNYDLQTGTLRMDQRNPAAEEL